MCQMLQIHRDLIIYVQACLINKLVQRTQNITLFGSCVRQIENCVHIWVQARRNNKNKVLHAVIMMILMMSTTMNDDDDDDHDYISGFLG
jgi:hypothetical protein